MPKNNMMSEKRESNSIEKHANEKAHCFQYTLITIGFFFLG